MLARKLFRAWKPGRFVGQRKTFVAGGLAVLACCIMARAVWGPGSAAAAPRNAPAANAPPPSSSSPQSTVAPLGGGDPTPKPEIVAVVNGEKIVRNDLAREALRHYGNETLETMLNKYLIVDQCELKHITVSSQEVSDEIQRMAERFGLSTDAWLKMLKEERNITPIQYARDIVWPSLALRKLADARLQVTDEELQQAYETQFGSQVQVRLIALSSLEKAREILATALKSPDEFGNLAKQYSEDVNSASVKGLVPPIRRHLGIRSCKWLSACNRARSPTSSPSTTSS